MNDRVSMAAEQRGNCTLVRVQSPRIDASVSADFKDRLKAMIQGGDHNMEIDLTAVDLIDSSGLGALVGVLKVLPASGSLRLTGLNAFNRRVFHLTKLDRVFEIA